MEGCIEEWMDGLGCHGCNCTVKLLLVLCFILLCKSVVFLCVHYVFLYFVLSEDNIR